MNLKILAPIVIIGIIVVAAVAILPGDSTPQATIVFDPSDTDSESSLSTQTIMETNDLQKFKALNLYLTLIQ